MCVYIIYIFIYLMSWVNNCLYSTYIHTYIHTCIPNLLVSEEFDDEEEVVDVEGARERVCGSGATLSKT